jgi:hypothetical protein
MKSVNHRDIFVSNESLHPKGYFYFNPGNAVSFLMEGRPLKSSPLGEDLGEVNEEVHLAELRSPTSKGPGLPASLALAWQAGMR